MLTKDDLIPQIDTCMVLEYVGSSRKGITLCKHLARLGLYPTKEAYRSMRDCMEELTAEHLNMFGRSVDFSRYRKAEFAPEWNKN